MSDNSAIEWTDATWNPVHGCSKVSAGCTNCYAEKVSHRFGFTSKPWNVAYAAENVQLHPERLDQPLRWTRPRRIFVNSMSDLFHEHVPKEFIEEVFAVMSATPQHTYQILTKRPERMLEWFTHNRAIFVSGAAIGMGLRPPRVPFDKWWPLPNVWLGVSVENQQAADERIPLLLQTPAAVRFLSCEPLLGPVNLKQIELGIKTTGWGERRVVWDVLSSWEDQYTPGTNETFPRVSASRSHPKVDWVIAGGESGPNARPMHPNWARDLRDQYVAAGVPYFFKQWGEFAPVHELRCDEPGIKGKQWVNFDPDTSVCRVGKKNAGRLLDGRSWDEYPMTGGVSDAGTLSL